MKLERFRRASLVSQERHPDVRNKRDTAQGNVPKVENTGCMLYALPYSYAEAIESLSLA
jgi:hypothetical protein